MKKAKNGKKKSPRSIPATKADVAKAKKEASSEAVTRAWAIMFSVLHDKEGYEQADLQRVWNEIQDVCDSINRGYITLADLQNTLRVEAGTRLVGG